MGGSLVAGILLGDAALIGKALNSDAIVEPVRGPLIPGFGAVKEAALAAGALRQQGRGAAVWELCCVGRRWTTLVLMGWKGGVRGQACGVDSGLSLAAGRPDCTRGLWPQPAGGMGPALGYRRGMQVFKY